MTIYLLRGMDYLGYLTYGALDSNIVGRAKIGGGSSGGDSSSGSGSSC